MEQMLYIGNKIEAATTTAISDAIVAVLGKLHEVHASEVVQLESLRLLQSSFKAPSELTISNCTLDNSTRKEVVVNTEECI
jgi:3-dehydroquinate dehydratase